LIPICISTGFRPWLSTARQIAHLQEKTGAGGVELLLTKKSYEKIDIIADDIYLNCVPAHIKSMHTPFAQGKGSLLDRLFTLSTQAYPENWEPKTFFQKSWWSHLVTHLNDPSSPVLKNLDQYQNQQKIIFEYREKFSGSTGEFNFKHPEDFRKFLDENNLLCCFDVGYAAESWPNLTLKESFMTLAPRVKIIHLYDIKFKGGLLGMFDKNLILGKGVLEQEIIELLEYVKYIKFPGHIVLEISPFYRLASVRKMVKRIREILEGGE